MRFRTPAERKRHILSQHKSGLSISAYCKRTGIVENTFYNWRKHFKADTAPTPISFLKIPTQQDAIQTFDVTLPNGARLTMPLPCDLPFLQQTIALLSNLTTR